MLRVDQKLMTALRHKMQHQEAVIVPDHVYFVHPSTDISGRHIDRLSTDVSVNISVECRPICRPIYRSRVGRYVGRYMSVDLSTDVCRSTYRPMYIGRVMVDISTDYRQISRSI